MKDSLKNAECIKNNAVFRGLSDDEREEFLENVNSFVKKYEKGEVLRLTGNIEKYLAIVITGRIYIGSYDEKGNNVIFSYVDPGGHFGVSYAITGVPSMVDVTAGVDSEVLFIEMNMLRSDQKLSEIDVRVRGNLLLILAKKNLNLSRKIRTVSDKTIRGKLNCYLRDESIVRGTTEFDLTFDRQTFADYLNCDRSQLSKELAKMQKEGLIEYSGKHFKLFF